MRLSSTFRSILLACGAAFALGACTQGEDIASPGATNPGTPPGSSGGGGGGGGGTAQCPAGFATGTSVGGLTVCNVSGTLLTNLTLPFVQGVAYRLNGRVDVGIDRGADGTGGTAATLTIQSGVVVFGASGADYLVVNRGSRIIADGEADAPIIFTSANDLTRRAADPNDTGGSAISEWGGVVVLGRAPINRCITGTPGTSQCEQIVEGVTNPEAVYGGAVADDDSGVIRYVQVRFAGFAINQQGNELNGLTLGGIGAGTDIEFVQVHNNSDDGIEVFGGTVNLKHIVLTGNDDDSLDTDNGWTGNVQYLVIKQRTDGGDNGMEMSSAPGVSPPTNPTIANFTLVGARTNAFRINTGHVGRFLNGVVAYGAPCFRWENSAGDGDPATYSGLTDPTFNSVLFDCTALTSVTPDMPAAVASIAADANNVVGMSSLTSMLFPGPNENGVTAFDLTTLPGIFFEDTNYIGAFGPTESETSNWATGWTFALFPAPTCPAGTTDSGTQINGLKVCNVSGVRTTDLALVRGNLYQIDGRIDVGVDIGADGAAVGGVAADLTIESGVTLFGDSGADYIVVNRGSRIFSNGTLQNPVVFTSEADLRGTQPDPLNAISEWGGLVILGRAPINRCITGTPGAAQCEQIIEGVTNPEAVYGGAVANDSSGALHYTQVKHAGFAINQQGNELNGITLGGVGNGTVVDYVQVHNNSDDGIEVFGGTVNLKHIVLTGNDDDSLDTDNGWNGNLQYLIIVQRAIGGDNGMEMSSAPGVSPPTDPTIANFTIVGARTNAFRINTGHVGRFLNGVVAYGAPCMRWENSAGDGDPASYSGLADPTFNSVLFDCTALTSVTPDVPGAVGSVAADANNTTTVMDSLINVFINGPNETARTPYPDLTTLPAGSFFDDVDYVGAVRDANDRWWADWSCGLEASAPC